MESTSLVRPGDITDAVDGQDLLDTILSENLDRIDKKNDDRTRIKWVADQREEIILSYNKRALKAYEKMWDRCGKSKVGHNFRNIDQSGCTVLQCDTCAHVAPLSAKPDTYDYSSNWGNENHIANIMNQSLIKALGKRMRDIDEEAGVLVWPTIEDYSQRKGWR